MGASSGVTFFCFATRATTVAQAREKTRGSRSELVGDETDCFDGDGALSGCQDRSLVLSWQRGLQFPTGALIHARPARHWGGKGGYGREALVFDGLVALQITMATRAPPSQARGGGTGREEAQAEKRHRRRERQWQWQLQRAAAPQAGQSLTNSPPAFQHPAPQAPAQVNSRNRQQKSSDSPEGPRKMLPPWSLAAEADATVAGSARARQLRRQTWGVRA